MVKISAEVGSVHDGSLGNAKALSSLAKNIGADIVKFQTHIAKSETLKDAPMPPFFKGEPRYDYFIRTSFSQKQWITIKKHCIKVNYNSIQAQVLPSPSTHLSPRIKTVFQKLFN